MTSDLPARVQKLEKTISERQNGPKDGWDIFRILAPLFIPASIAFVGYLVSGSLKQAEIASAEKMAEAQKEVALIGARVSQAQLVNTFMKALLSTKIPEQKLAIEAVLIAFPDGGGDRLVEILSQIGTSVEVQEFAVTRLAFDRRLAIEPSIDGLDAPKAKALVSLIVAAFPEMKPVVEAQYPDSVRAADTSGAKAKILLKRMVSATVILPKDMEKWEAEISGL